MIKMYNELFSSFCNRLQCWSQNIQRETHKKYKRIFLKDLKSCSNLGQPKTRVRASKDSGEDIAKENDETDNDNPKTTSV